MAESRKGLLSAGGILSIVVGAFGLIGGGTDDYPNETQHTVLASLAKEEFE